jgi:hypothetical protein
MDVIFAAGASEVAKIGAFQSWNTGLAVFASQD